MSLPRTPLTPISGNRRRGPELTPYQRGVIAGQLQAGLGPRQIEKKFGTPESTVRSTQEVAFIRYHGESLPRPGQPKKLSERDRRKLIRITRREPKITYAALKRAAGLDCCYRTLQNELRAYGLLNWRAKKRPLLTPDVAAKRLA